MKRLSTFLVLSMIIAASIAVVPAVITGAEPPIPAKKYEKIVFIHYASRGKPQPTPVDNTAYKLIGPKWFVLPVSYVIDPDGAPNGAVTEIELAFETWDKVTSKELFNPAIVDTSAEPSLGAPDFNNVVCWRGIAPTTIIAMTVFWYDDKTGDGPSLDDVTVDCDVIFNALLKWGIDPDDEGPTKLVRAYDVQNIATHEAGHVVGLNDLYEDQYRELTMYGYSATGETLKISLQTGDISGCQALYGA